MFEIDYKSPEIEARTLDGMDMVLTADIPVPVKLYQGQSKTIKTGVAVKSDQHVFAVPLRELNEIGLVMGSGVELLNTVEGDEIELVLWNRNQQGTPRMIEILPEMALATMVVFPRYNVAGEGKAPAPKKRGPKPRAAKETAPATGTDG